MSSRMVFPCNTCDLIFEDSQAQRKHMREPWHVYNLKRRIATLSPISADTYAESVATNLVSSKHESSGIASSTVERVSSEEEPAEKTDDIQESVDEQAHNNCCLFCTDNSDSPETNLEHMSSEHGLFIPEIERLSNLETVISYLRTVIAKYGECLYCGVIKQSAESARRHMLDKGHCMINLEREPELLEFWEFSDNDEDETNKDEAPRSRTPKVDPAVPRVLSQDEYTLPSGKIVGSKGKARETQLLARRTALAAKDTSSPEITKGSIENAGRASSAGPAEPLERTQGGNQDRTVAVRDAAGLIGVSDQQIRGLITIQRKTQRQQAIVQASAAWADELGGRSQKHFKVKMNLRAG